MNQEKGFTQKESDPPVVISTAASLLLQVFLVAFNQVNSAIETLYLVSF